VRELENAIERAVILSPGAVIEAHGLPERIVTRKAEPLVTERQQANPSLEAIERAYITWVLQSEGGNKSAHTPTSSASTVDAVPQALALRRGGVAARRPVRRSGPRAGPPFRAAPRVVWGATGGSPRGAPPRLSGSGSRRIGAAARRRMREIPQNTPARVAAAARHDPVSILSAIACGLLLDWQARCFCSPPRTDGRTT
jgi:hypothetical protein